MLPAAPHNNQAENDLLLKVENLRVYFHGDGPVAKAVDGIDFQVRRQQTVCIVGESGCGKTVTALTVMGLLHRPPASIASGRITFDGRDLLDMGPDQWRALRGRHMAMIFQEPMTSLNPVFTIGDQICEAMLSHNGLSQSQARDKAVELLDDVGIQDADRRLDDYPHQLSGGQRQRAMIAMALAGEPDLIIADEPTTALDVTVQAQILKLLRELQERRHMAIQYITHDLGVVSVIAHQIYVMYAGIMVEQGTAAQIFEQACHPYTRALLASLPTGEKRGQRLYTIPGSVPHPAYKPPGCPFHPRCDYRQTSCTTDYPDMCDYGNGHLARCPVVFVGDGPSPEDRP
jgi:oligopeptide/dipeptide ABC transporter ATP-binding protein